MRLGDNFRLLLLLLPLSTGTEKREYVTVLASAGGVPGFQVILTQPDGTITTREKFI
jgi:hypothetical protein